MFCMAKCFARNVGNLTVDLRLSEVHAQKRYGVAEGAQKGVDVKGDPEGKVNSL